MYAIAKTTTTTKHSATEASTKKETTTANGFNNKDPESSAKSPTKASSTHANSTHATSTHASSIHASSTHASSIDASSTHESSTHESSTLESTHVSSGTTVMPMLPTVATSSTLPSSTALSEQSSSSSSSSGGIIGGIVAAVAVLIIAVGAFLLMHRKKARRTLRAQRNKPDPFTMGFGSDDPKPLEHYEVTPIPHEEDQYKQQYQPQLSPPPHNNLPVNAATAATVLASTAPTPIEEHKSIGSFTVIATYIPTLSDELEIEAGDHIDLIVEYDDGWCQGVNLSKGNTTGVFPRHCIDYATVPSNHVPNFDVERSKRVSSMYVM